MRLLVFGFFLGLEGVHRLFVFLVLATWIGFDQVSVILVSVCVIMTLYKVIFFLREFIFPQEKLIFSQGFSHMNSKTVGPTFM